MKIKVLGSAAGGGFPQWNCHCRNCAGVRCGHVNALARTQSSIAVSGSTDDAWVLVNASPDIRAQLETITAEHPSDAPRDTAIRAIVLVDAQIDHTTGLFMLREASTPWPLFCTDRVFEDLTSGNPILNVLRHYCGIDRRVLPSDGEQIEIEGAEDVLWRAVSISSQPPPFSPNRGSPEIGDNVALLLHDLRGEKSVFYAPGLGGFDARTWALMQSANCVLVDGTFWTDDEMISVGVSGKRARDIGHLPQSGPGGMIEWLDRLPATTRKILIHINNTNPILDEDSPQRAEVLAHGIEIAWDGMEIEL